MTAENPDCAMLLSVHDELVFEVTKGEETKYAGQLKEIMDSVYKLKVPIEAHAKAGLNWCEMENMDI
jgi:DNA polymerase-1